MCLLTDLFQIKLIVLGITHNYSHKPINGEPVMWLYCCICGKFVLSGCAYFIIIHISIFQQTTKYQHPVLDSKLKH